MTTDVRRLAWDGCFNARDLGGFPTRSGALTRFGAVVRSDHLDHLSVDGWRGLERYGIRTVIDLRNEDEREHLPPCPADLRRLHLPLDDVEATGFWDEWNASWHCGTPGYYSDHLQRFPERSGRVLAAIAHAEPGGVLFHCMGGRDRTGMITMLLLWLVGVSVDRIVADYELSAACLTPFFAARGEPDQGPLIADFLEAEGTSFRELIADTLAALDLARFVAAGGLTEADLAALRARLVA